MAIDRNKDLNIDETRTVLQGLKDAGVFNSQEQIGKNLARFQKTNSTTAVSPTDVSGSPRYEIPDSTKSNKTSSARQNVTAGAFDFSNYVSKLGQDTVNQQDINKGNSSMVQGLLDKIGGKQSKGDMKSDIRSDVESETGYNVADLTMQAEEYQGQLDAEQRAFDVERRRLLDNPEGLGQSALQGRVAQAERYSLQKQADIAILGNFAANKLDKAQTLINDRLDLEYGDQKQEIDDYVTMISAVSGLSNDVKAQLKESAQEEKDILQENKEMKRYAFGIAKSVAGTNPALANRIVSGIQGEASNESLSSLVSQYEAEAINSGAYIETSSDNSDYGNAELWVASTGENGGADLSDDEIKSELLKSTNLSVSEINAIIANKGAQDARGKAKSYLEDTYDAPGFSRIFPGNQTQSQWNKAREDARLLIEDDLKIGVLTQRQAREIMNEVEGIKLSEIKQ